MNKSSWKFLIAFAAIILLVLAGYWVWNNRSSLTSEGGQDTNANYEIYLAHQKSLEEKMRNDTYGGKTPQETLDLFIEALRKNDVELAFLYFNIEENGERDPKWREALVQTRDAGRLQETINLLSRAKPDPNERSYEKDFKLVVREGSEVRGYIDLELNEYSGVWKIESL